MQDAHGDEPSALHQHLPAVRPKLKGVTLTVRDSCGQVRAITYGVAVWITQSVRTGGSYSSHFGTDKLLVSAAEEHLCVAPKPIMPLFPDTAHRA